MAEIAKCRWCGTDAGIVRRVSSENYFVACMCQHEIIGPKMPTESEAITAWNEMMGQLDTTENDRRDRIERAAIAIYAAHVCGTKMGFDGSDEIYKNSAILIDGVGKFLASERS